MSLNQSQPFSWTQRASSWQKWLMPDKGYAAGDWVNSISLHAAPSDRYTSQSKSPLTSRIQIAVLPLFAFVSAIQMGTNLLCSMTLAIVGLDNNRAAIFGEYGILDILIKSIAAIFTSFITMPIGLNDPTMYVRPQHEFKSEEVLTSIESSQSRNLTLEQVLKKVTTITPAHIQSVSALQTGYGFEFSYNPTQKSGKYVWEGFTSETLEEIKQLDSSPSFSLPRIDDIDTFLRPARTMELTIRTIDLPYVHTQLDGVDPKVQGLDVLTLIGSHHKLRTLTDFNSRGILRNLKALVLRNNTVSFEEIAAFNKAFPKVACFDLRGCILKGDEKILEPLKEDLIILTDTSNNAQEQLDKLNQKIIQGVYAQLKGTGGEILTSFPSLPAHLSEETLYYSGVSPAACFVPKLECLSHIPIGEAIFKTLIERLSIYFRSLTRLDLSGSPTLTSSNITVISNQLRLTHLRLKGCPMIYTRPTLKRRTNCKSSVSQDPDEAFKALTKKESTNVSDELMGTFFRMFVNGLEYLDISDIKNDRFNRYLMNPPQGLFPTLDTYLPQVRREVTIIAGVEEEQKTTYTLPIKREILDSGAAEEQEAVS